MGVLNRKLHRDLLRSTGAMLAVVAIISVGTGSFIAMGSAQRILEASQAEYYRDYRFADFWVDVKKAPLTAVDRIARLPGVAAVEPRVVFDVILDLPDTIEPIGGRLISAPARGFDRTLNGVCLIRGSGFSDDRDEETIISESFAEAHDLEPGDRIDLILNRKRESFRIAGTALSPEYVYPVRGEGDFTPDPEHFGILYVKQDFAREVLDFKDSCNQIVGRLVSGNEEDVDPLLDRIDRLLQPYGVLATTPRAQQASHRFLSDEITGLGINAVVMPTIFLFVAALVLNIVMTRVAERQRTIVGTLKAIGCSNRGLTLHFLSFGVVVGVVGGMAGIGVGLSLCYWLIQIYPDYFQFPSFAYRVYPDLLAIGVLISVGFTLAGTARGVRSVLRLKPAEAMRPTPPARGGSVFLERLPALWRSLSFRSQVALRSLLRNRGRTLTGIFSSAISTAIILMTLMMYDSLWFLVDFQFEHVSRSDADIGMHDERSWAALFEARDLPGVDYAEPVLGLACDLRHGRQSRRLGIIGLSGDQQLTTPRKRDLTPIDIPRRGLVLSAKLAQVLDTTVGDHVELTPIRGRRRTVSAPVAAIVESFIGMDCYANISYLSELIGEPDAVNLVQMSVDPSAKSALYRAAKRLPNAQGFTVRANMKANIESTFVETMGASLGLMIVFAGVIALGSCVNSSLVEIADRRRDIATFRVLGYRPQQIAGIFFRQNMLIFTLGLIVSIPLGYGLVVVIAKAYDTELFRMPVVVKPATVMLTGLIAFTYVLAAQWLVYRQIVKLDWLEAVQANE